jgi:hypothetical protein
MSSDPFYFYFTGTWIPGQRWHGNADLILHQNHFIKNANKVLKVNPDPSQKQKSECNPPNACLRPTSC